MSCCLVVRVVAATAASCGRLAIHSNHVRTRTLQCFCECVRAGRVRYKVKGKQSIAVYVITTPLWEMTYHMGSHSVTCHPAEVTFPPLPQPKLVLDLATPKRCKAELT